MMKNQSESNKQVNFKTFSIWEAEHLTIIGGYSTHANLAHDAVFQ